GGIISAVEGDIDTASDGFENNERLFLPPTVFNRFAVTREINDGLLAPRFSPSQRAWIITGALVPVQPAVAASAGRDGDDREKQESGRTSREREKEGELSRNSDRAWQFAEITTAIRVGLGYANVDSIKLLSARGQTGGQRIQSQSLSMRFV